MRVFISGFCALSVFACAPAEPERAVAALAADAAARAAHAAGPDAACDILFEARRVAWAARLRSAETALQPLDAQYGCAGAGASFGALGRVAELVNTADRLSALAGAGDWLSLRLTGLAFESDRRAVRLYDALPKRCRRQTDRRRPAPEIISAYLADPDRRLLRAQLQGAGHYDACAAAFETAAQDHAGADEGAWASWWRYQAANLPAGAGWPVLVAAMDAEAQAGEPAIAHMFAELAASALLDRAELADFEAVSTLAARPELIAATPDWRSQPLVLALGAAAAGDVAVRLGPVAAPYADNMDIHAAFTLADWTREGLLDGAPGALGRLQALCGRTRLDEASVHDMNQADKRTLRCGHLAARLRASLSTGEAVQTARADALTFALALIERGAPADLALGDAARADHDMLERAALHTPSAMLRSDDYGCPRPGPALEPLWAAAAPTLASMDCARLDRLRPDPDDPAGLAAALPMGPCQPDVLAGAPRGAMRRLTYAARAGSVKAYECFARIGAVEAERRDYASHYVLAAIQAGVARGDLSPDDWTRAGGDRADPALLEIYAYGFPAGDKREREKCVSPDKLTSPDQSLSRKPARMCL